MASSVIDPPAQHPRWPVTQPELIDPWKLTGIAKREIEFYQSRLDIGPALIHDLGSLGFTLSVFQPSLDAWRVVTSRRADLEPRFFRTLDTAWRYARTCNLTAAMIALPLLALGPPDA